MRNEFEGSTPGTWKIDIYDDEINLLVARIEGTCEMVADGMKFGSLREAHFEYSMGCDPRYKHLFDPETVREIVSETINKFTRE